MRTHLQSAQHVIPSYSGKYHSGYGHIIRTLCEYLCSHKDIHYGSMQVMSRLLHVYKPQSSRSKIVSQFSPEQLVASIVPKLPGEPFAAHHCCASVQRAATLAALQGAVCETGEGI